MADNVNTSSLAGSILPKVYITEIAIRDNDNPGGITKVDLRLSIKDVIEKDSSNTWFYNSDFTKYLKIVVIQSNNSTATNLLNDDKPLGRGSGDETFFELYLAGKINSPEDTSSISRIDIPVESAVGDGGTFDIRKFSSITTTTGEKVYEIKYFTTFDLPQKDHLNYWAFVQADLQQMASDYGLSLKNLTAMTSDIVEERAITEGETVKFADLYYLEGTEEIWTGPTYLSQDGLTYKTGSPRRAGGRGKNKIDDPSSRNLRKETVPNGKLKDYRQVSQTQLALPDLKPALREFQKSTKKLLNRDQLHFDSEESYVSTAYLSPTRGGDVNMLFQVDLRKLVRQQSAFGSLFEIPNPTPNMLKAREEIYRLSRIKNLKILRRRISKVKSINKLGTKVESFLFDASRNIEETLIYSADVDGTLEKKENNDFALKEVPNLRMSENTRAFTVSDNQMGEITDGFYQYGVEIEAEDGSVIFLNNQLDRLIEAQKGLQLYYQDSLSARYLLEDGSFSEEFSFKYENLGQEPWEASINTFVDVYSSIVPIGGASTSLFTQAELFGLRRQAESVVDRQIQSETGTVTEEQRQSRIRSFFSTILSSLVPGRTEQTKDAETLINNLLAMTNPVDGSSKGIYAFLKMINSVVDYLETTLDSKRIVKQSSINLTKSSTKNVAKVSSLGIKKFFKNVHDSNIYRDVGFDFLGKEGKQEYGTKAILFEDMFQRADEEAQIYWTSTDMKALSETLINEKTPGGDNTSINDDESLFNLTKTRLAYLTPANIFANPLSFGRVDAGSKLWDTTYYNSIAAKIVAIQGNGSPVFSPSSTFPEGFQDSRDRALENVLSQLGVIIVDEQEQPAMLGTPNSAFTTPVSNIFGNNDPVNQIIKTSTFNEAKTDNAETEERKKTAVKNRILENKFAIGNILVNDLTATRAFGFSDSASKKSNFKPSKPNSLQQYNLLNSNNVIDSLRNSPLDSVTIDQVPNQTRSLLFSSTTAVKNDWTKLEQDPLKSPETAQMMRFNYETIAKISVFAGFEKDKDGNNIIMKPRFEMLTDEIVEAATERVLLCKMELYRNDVLNIGAYSESQMPIYDAVFLLTPNQTLLDQRLVVEAPAQTAAPPITTVTTTTTTSKNKKQRDAKYSNTQPTKESKAKNNYFSRKGRRPSQDDGSVGGPAPSGNGTLVIPTGAGLAGTRFNEIGGASDIPESQDANGDSGPPIGDPST